MFALVEAMFVPLAAALLIGVATARWVFGPRRRAYSEEGSGGDE